MWTVINEAGVRKVDRRFTLWIGWWCDRSVITWTGHFLSRTKLNAVCDTHASQSNQTFLRGTQDSTLGERPITSIDVWGSAAYGGSCPYPFYSYLLYYGCNRICKLIARFRKIMFYIEKNKKDILSLFEIQRFLLEDTKRFVTRPLF